MKLFGKSKAKTQPRAPQHNQTRLIKQIIDHFAIGDRIKYSIEYEQHSKLETIIIGYKLDDYFVFTNNDIRFDGDDSNPQLLLKTGEGEIALRHFSTFQIMLPGDLKEEVKLDYVTRANMGTRGQFGLNKVLTLYAIKNNRLCVSIDSVVRRNLVLSKGVHSGRQVALLELVLRSYEMIDQRKNFRLETSIEAILEDNSSGECYQCTMRDFSEQALRLRLDQQFAAIGERLAAGEQAVVIRLQLSDRHAPTVLQAQPLRREGSDLIMRVEAIEQPQGFIDYQMIDALDLKIAILQHPNTRQDY